MASRSYRSPAPREERGFGTDVDSRSLQVASQATWRLFHKQKKLSFSKLSHNIKTIKKIKTGPNINVQTRYNVFVRQLFA